MRTPILILLTFLVAQPNPDPQAQALERINAYRKTAGLEPVVIDPALSKGCLAHAQYLAKNADHPSTKGLGMHKEDPKLPGFSEEGSKAGASSVIYPIADPVAAVDGWMASLFHRVPLLDSQLERVGLGYAKGGKAGGYFVVDTISGRGTKGTEKAVLFPIDKQKDVPLRFFPEYPEPIPAAREKSAGFPVTVMFPMKAVVTGVTASLKDAAGKDVEAWLSTPEEPAAGEKDFQRNTICLIAKAPLRASNSYTATVKATVNGEAWTQTWSFTAAAK